MENDNKQNKKPLLYYIALVSLIILLLNPEYPEFYTW